MKITKTELKNDNNNLICSTCLLSSIAYNPTETIIYCNYYEKEMVSDVFESFLESTNVDKQTRKGDFCKIESIIIREIE